MFGVTATSFRVLGRQLPMRATRVGAALAVSPMTRASGLSIRDRVSMLHTSIAKLPSEKSAVVHENLDTYVTISLIPLIGVSVFYGPQPINDFLLGIAFPIHAYFGICQPIGDYVRADRYPKLHFLFTWMLKIGAALALYGCYIINTKDVGITAYVKRLWNSRNSANTQ
ncbi:Succinate dehydrogenase [ubiquinone] cytochrome b small subunit, mitochondrial [Zancudomyces culisetae]|uniref:Succinate dehydrogenase [ubiquinone] cytochrome b small subunit n=1 Tax=Zancudomyces culisetae TaxID=1213189 RepID=A0A1R1PRL7_ZANCU|nr:Succinate dehydrogenase [ubiquinone] cytochrome b small subunit, mitochondrial [Zancudomyces culisetae]|eukprot:OMH83607.1 Succinate dehydrogenase [ubiquinone] cytochrome b small subunit, mitochondrial [Zancudomyces culisetae]